MTQVSGEILKIAKRFRIYRLVLLSSPKRVIADFTEPPPETPRKLRQGDQVSISGEFESEGYESVVLSGCRLLSTN